MITLASKNTQNEDIGIGFDLATNQLILWTPHHHREITLAELAELHPDLAADVAAHLAAIHGGYEA